MECFATCALERFDCWDMIHAYQARVEHFDHQRDSYGDLEIAKIKIADALLQVLGLPTEPPDPVIEEPPTRKGKKSIPEGMRWTVFERDNFTCKNCGSRKHLEADHIHPESKGGPTTLENLQTLCHPCNVRKGATVKL